MSGVAKISRRKPLRVYLQKAMNIFSILLRTPGTKSTYVSRDECLLWAISCISLFKMFSSEFECKARSQLAKVKGQAHGRKPIRAAATIL